MVSRQSTDLKENVYMIYVYQSDGFDETSHFSLSSNVT